MSETKVKVRQIEGLEDELDDKAPILNPQFEGEVSVEQIRFPDNTILNSAADIATDVTGQSLGLGTPVYVDKDENTLRFRSIAAGSNVSLATANNTITISASLPEASGEANTLTSVGTGTGTLPAGKVDEDIKIKSLAAGSNISLVNGATSVTISSTAENNTGSNLGDGSEIYAGKSGSALQFKTLKAGTNTSITSDANTVTISATGGAGGEANTASNIGTGSGVFEAKSGVDLRFKSIKAGSNVTVTPSSTDITIAATGEANTLADVGAGTGKLAYSKSGTTLRVKSIAAGNNISVTNGADSVTVSTTAEENLASNLGTGTGVYSGKSGSTLQFKSLKAGSGVALTSDSTSLTISSTGSSLWADNTTYISPITKDVAAGFNIYDKGGFYSKIPTQSGNITGYGSMDINAFDNWSPIPNQFLIKSKRLKENYTATHSDYRILTWLSSHVVVHDTAAGYQQYFTSDSGGRTMTNAYEAMVTHRARGDCNGFFATVSVMGHDNMSAISGNWGGQPSGTVIGGHVFANAPKTNIYGLEFQIDGNGQPNVNGLGCVINLIRGSSVAQYQHIWVGYLVQGLTTTYSDIGFVARGYIKSGFDTRGMIQGSGTNGKIAFAASTGQRIYLGCTPTSFGTIASTPDGIHMTDVGGRFAFSAPLQFANYMNVSGPTISASASAGTANALPANPFTYLTIQLDGVNYKIPVYNA
jgi:hypothetical protein